MLQGFHDQLQRNTAAVLSSLLGCFCDDSSLPRWRSAFAVTARAPKRAGSRFLNAPAALNATPLVTFKPALTLANRRSESA